MSDSSWLVDIAIGLVNSVLILPNGQVIKLVFGGIQVAEEP